MTIADVVWRRIDVAVHPAGSAAWPGYVFVLLLLAVVAICLLFLWPEVRRSDGGTDDSDQGGSGGGDWGRGPTPPCPPPDTDPAWWPEFEREFAAYVNGDRARAGDLVVRDIAIRAAQYDDVRGDRSPRSWSRGRRRRWSGVGVS